MQFPEMLKPQQAIIDQCQNPQAAINGCFHIVLKQIQAKITENMQAAVTKDAKTEEEELI